MRVPFNIYVDIYTHIRHSLINITDFQKGIESDLLSNVYDVRHQGQTNDTTAYLLIKYDTRLILKILPQCQNRLLGSFRTYCIVGRALFHPSSCHKMTTPFIDVKEHLVLYVISTQVIVPGIFRVSPSSSYLRFLLRVNLVVKLVIIKFYVHIRAVHRHQIELYVSVYEVFQK